MLAAGVGAGPQVIGVNLEPSVQGTGSGQGQAGNVAQARGNLQQALVNMFQGAMFPQQQGNATRPAPPVAVVAGTPTVALAASATASPPAPQPTTGTGTTATTVPIPTVPTGTGAVNPLGIAQQGGWSYNIRPLVPTAPAQPRASSAPATPEGTPSAIPNAATAAQAQAQALQSLFGPALHGHHHRRRDILLNCHSLHNSREPPSPARPEGLVQFLSQQMGGLTQDSSHDLDREYFEMLLGFCQILNSAHPVMIHYIQGSLLRGRDATNPNHVLTGVRSYGRRFAEWIVVSFKINDFFKL